MVNSSLSSLDSTITGTVVQDLCSAIRFHVKAEEVKEKRCDRDRIGLLLENVDAQKEIQFAIQKQLNSDKNHCEKNKTTALSFKDAGNALFGKGKYEEALHFYNKCTAWMPIDGTKDPSIVYANRSAALFHLGEISLAQQDVKLAFSLNYPTELHYKLHERSGRCFLSLGKTSEACRSFKLAVTALQNALLDESKIIKTKNALDELIKTASNTKANFSNIKGSKNSRITDECFLLPELAGGQNKMLRAASNKLSLSKSEKAGRFIIANQDIQPGDVLVVQKAFVSTLLPENYHQQCYHCFKPILAPIPCKECVLTSYCSQKCRDDAWSSYHVHECKILGVLAISGISVTCYMALRLIVQTKLEELHKWAELVNEAEKTEDEDVGKNGEANKGKTSAGTTGGGGSGSCVQARQGVGEQDTNEEYRADHISLFQLVTHSRRRGAEDIFQRTVMAMFLLVLLKTTSFLPPSPSQTDEKPAGGSLAKNNDGAKSSGKAKVERKNVDELTVGTILLRSLQFLQFNAHEVAGWNAESFKSSFLGGGLYPTLALFNHSCNPAIVRYFINDTVVVRAVRTIYRGEQVTENYGPLFTAHTREERLSTLQNQYWFDCQCVCCREDWATFDNMPSDSMNFRCSFCHASLGKFTEENMGLLLQCRRCSRPTNILKSLKDLQSSEGKYKEAMDFLAKGRDQTALGILLQNISLFDSILLPPIRDYHLCQEAARKCFLTLGNKTYTRKFS